MNKLTASDSDMADTIERAINEYLWDGEKFCINKRTNSCGAIIIAVNRLDTLPQEINDFLISLGCDTESAAQFNELEGGKKRQYARALWLTWAAMIAREEGR